MTSLRRRASACVDVHRAELEHLDQLVVEAVALLPEEDRARAVELDGECDERASPARSEQQQQCAEDAVLDMLGDAVPVGQRLV